MIKKTLFLAIGTTFLITIPQSYGETTTPEAKNDSSTPAPSSADQGILSKEDALKIHDTIDLTFMGKTVLENKKITSLVSLGPTELTKVTLKKGAITGQSTLISSQIGTFVIMGETYMKDVKGDTLTITGKTHFDNVDVDNLTIIGRVEGKGLTSKSASLTGFTSITNLTANTLTVTGAVNAEQWTVKDKVGITGQTIMTKSDLGDLTLIADRADFKGCVLKSILVKKDGDKKQVVVIKGKSTVGDVTFESKKGKLVLGPEVTLTGKVAGAVVKRL